ncbi:hypothetical protein PPN31114_00210 [Pandoraea pneumonica]|uniref:Uncharacterized protein n=1 Tax=Pandoraea pneumonica TaxID=2508299 RepID=A0A5E4RMV3_9BURK|nr:hypothetical protein [Pandoraea pneumonica]VVD63198.1 hypothetical protein PPN31114_00210 [Pandoraea pneumonica]
MPDTLLAVELFEDGDQTGVRYRNGDPDKPVAIETFDRLIAVLGDCRAAIEPPITADPPPPHLKMTAAYDPRWQVGPDPMGGGAVLKIRHPGFGWLAFAIPLPEVENFCTGLAKIAQAMAMEAQDHGPAN